MRKFNCVLFVMAVWFSYAAFADTWIDTKTGVEWVYTVSDGKASVGGGLYSPAVPTTTSGKITIPSTLGGCPVTAIGKYAFYNCDLLTGVTIPEGVTSIECNAFYYCANLLLVTIPSSVASIGSSAFSSCANLKNGVVSFLGVPPECLSWSGIPQYTKIRYNSKYAAEWETAIDECNFYSAEAHDFAADVGGVVVSGNILESAGDAGWSEVESSVYKSGAICDGQKSVAVLQVEDAGTLSFDWKVSSEKYFDKLSVLVDGKAITNAIHGVTDWTKVSFAVTGSGKHVIQWIYRKDGDATAGDDCGWIRRVRYGTAVMPWKWTSTIEHYYSSYYGRDEYYVTEKFSSGEISDGEATEATLLVTGSSRFCFNYKVSSEEGHDFLQFLVDGELKAQWSGEAEDNYYITFDDAGTHTLTWRYVKDGVGSSGDDCVMISSLDYGNGIVAWPTSEETPSVGKSSWTATTTSEYDYDYGYYQTVKTYQSGGGDSRLPMTVVGDGYVSFSVKGSVSVYLDGEYVTRSYSYGSEEWTGLRAYTGGEGAHQISIRASSSGVTIKNLSFSIGRYDDTWLWSPTVTPVAPEVGDASWSNGEIDYSTGYTSGKITDGQTSELPIKIYGDSLNLSFYWKVSCAEGDCLQLWVDDELKSSISGTDGDWQWYNESIYSYSSPHTVKFVYKKDSEGSEGDDCGWVKDFNANSYGTSYPQIIWPDFSNGSSSVETPAETVYTWATEVNDDGTLKITGVSPSPSGVLEFPSQINGTNVTAIGEYVYNNGEYASWWVCENLSLTEVVIPEGVITIDDCAFYSCASLVSITLPSTLRTVGYSAFSGTSIEALKLPEGMEAVKNENFSNMTKLKFVSMPSTLSSIGHYKGSEYYNPFTRCDPKCEFQFPNGNVRYQIVEGHLISNDGILLSGYVAGETVKIPEGVHEIATDSFAYRTSLKNVEMAASVRKVALNAFYGSGLQSVKLNEGLEEIAGQAFYDCANLSSINLPSSLGSIGYASFYRTAIKTLDVPASVTNFYCAANGMTNLVSITFRGNAPTCNASSASAIWGYSDAVVPSSAVIYVKRGSMGWAGTYDEELPSSGYWPYNSSSYGRKIYWYGEEPSDWTNPWWTKLNVSFSDSGWTGQRGVYTSPGWKNTTDSSSVHTNRATITVSGAGIIAFDVEATGRFSSDSRYLHVLIDGVEMDSYFAGSLENSYSRSAAWSHCEYGISEEECHEVTVEYRIPYVYYASYESAYLKLQNVVWTSKSSWTKPDYVWTTSDNGDGTVTITSVSPAPAFDLEIPSEVNGKKVTGVGKKYGSSSYSNNFSPSINLITSVILPEGVEELNQFAFYNCRRLKTISFPSTLTSLESGAFSGCYSLEEAILPEGMTTLGSSTFSSCRSLQRVRVPATVTSVGAYVFDYDVSLKEIIFAGDCPSVRSDMLEDVSATCEIKIFRGTTGWGVDVPGVWQNHPISYFETTPHVVTFDANGGTCNVASKTVYEQSVYSTLPAPTIADPHYCFDGWYTARQGGTKVVSSSIVSATANHTLYAHWVTAYYDVKITTLHGETSGGSFEYGTVNVFRAPDVVTEGTTRYICLGSSSYPGSGTEITLVAGTNTVSFAWDLWRTEYYVTIAAGSNGTIEGAETGWYEAGTILNMTAVGNAGYSISQWSGDLSECTINIDSCVDVVRRGHTVGASFKMGATSPYMDGGPYTNVVNGLSWVFTVSNGVAIVGGGNENLCAIPATTTGTITIPAILGDCSVYAIADYAFSNCKISSIKIPNTVRRIGNEAFWCCSSLASVAFPSMLEEIGTWSFADCSKLSSLTLTMPSLRSIGRGAFSSHNLSGSMSSATISGTNLVIGAEAFYKQPISWVSISGCDIEICESAFDHTGLSYGSWDCASVSLMGSGIVVGKRAFADMRHGGGVSLDLSGVSSLGEYAFAYAGYNQGYHNSEDGVYTAGATSVKFTSELKEAASTALNSSALGRIETDSIEAVFDCDGWLSFASQRMSGWSAYEGYHCHLYVNGECVTDIRIPDGTETVPASALRGVNLHVITVPASVMRIGDAAFATTLSAIQFEGAPMDCGSDAFYSCTAGAYTNSVEQWESVVEDGVWNGLQMSCGDVLDYSGAVDAEGLELTNTGWYTDWFVEASDTHDGDRAMRSNTDIRNGTGLSCEIVGPADISFWWKVASSGSQTSRALYFSVDGERISNVNEKSTWEQVATNLTAGAHKLAWEFYGVEHYCNNGECALLDELSITYDVQFDLDGKGARVAGGALQQKVKHGGSAVLPEVEAIDGYKFIGWSDDAGKITAGGTISALYRKLTVDEVLSGGKLSFEMTGDAEWSVVKDFTRNAVVAKSGSIDDDQKCSISTTIVGPGTISFNWKASSEVYKKTPIDYGVFSIDGSSKSEIGGETQWTNVIINIEGNGPHVLVWTYCKDEADSEGEDCMWLSDVKWTSASPIPDLGENPTPDEIKMVLEDFADGNLKMYITNAVNYNAYRDWAANVKTADGGGKAGAQAVKESSNAWFSFAVGSDKLISEMPTSDDIKVDEFVPSSESGKFDFTVSIDGVTVSEEALKENLKQVFGLEGSTSLDPNGFSSNNVDIDFDTPENGKVKFTAGPKSGSANTGTFFMKVKVNP